MTISAASAANYFQLDDDWEAFKNCVSVDFDCDAPPPQTRTQSDVTTTTGYDNYSAIACTTSTSAAAKDFDSASTAFASGCMLSRDDAPHMRCATRPHCSPIYISTTTKIAYMNLPIDIKRVFWEIPVLRYTDPVEGVIKKQIKFSTTDRDEYDAVMERIGKERYYDNQEMEHIDNPEGRIKFKDQRKISIGLSKKDILCYRSKKKRAFFNCFVIIIRMRDPGEIVDGPDYTFKEMHVKVFNTGKLEIPGIQTDKMMTGVLSMVIAILRPFVSEDLNYIDGRCDTVLINSNFNCGFYVNRDKLHELLKYKYRINSNYDSCSYPGIQSKFYYIKECGIQIQSGQQPKEGVECCEISFMIFRTGSVLIVGKCTEPILHEIYEFLKTILEHEYENIVNDLGCDNLETGRNDPCHKKKSLKVQRRIITCSGHYGAPAPSPSSPSSQLIES